MMAKKKQNLLFFGFIYFDNEIEGFQLHETVVFNQNCALYLIK